MEERQLLLVDLLSLASFSHGLTHKARAHVLSLPAAWLRAHIEAAAEPLLRHDDFEEYQGLLQIYEDWIRNLHQNSHTELLSRTILISKK